MATQTIRMVSTSDTDTIELASLTDDSEVDTAGATLVSGNLFTADFEDIPAGTYTVYARVGTTRRISDTITLLLATGLYYADSDATVYQLLADITATIDSDATGTGWPTTLRVGDAYKSNARTFRITIKDSAGSALTALDGNDFADGAANAVYRFDALNSPGNAADFVGELTWVPTAGGVPGHYRLQLSATETAKAIAGREYRGQLILWPGNAAQEITVDEWCFEALPKTAAP